MSLVPRFSALAIALSIPVTAITQMAPGAGQPPSFSYSADPEQRNVEYGLAKEVYAALGAWLETRDRQQGEACDAITSALITTGNPSVEMWFLAAKVAEARGRIDTTMQTLQGIVDRHAQEKTPGFQAPAGLSANMWLGRLARDNGDVDRALRAFEQAANELDGYPQLKFLTSLSNMYKAEVLTDFAQKPKEGIATFRQASKTMQGASAGSPPTPDELFGLWARWKLAERDASTTRQKCPERFLPLVHPMLFQMLALNGVSAVPRVDFYTGSDPKRSDWPKLFMREALQTTKSAIDRDALWFELAQFELQRKSYDEALAALDGIGDDSFFADIVAVEKDRIRGLSGGGGASVPATASGSSTPPAVANNPSGAGDTIRTPEANSANTSELKPETAQQSEPQATEEAGSAGQRELSVVWFGIAAIVLVVVVLGLARKAT